jgi:hypothetical protein
MNSRMVSRSTLTARRAWNRGPASRHIRSSFVLGSVTIALAGSAACGQDGPTIAACSAPVEASLGTWVGDPVSVPMAITSPSGSPRFSISIEIGGNPLDVLLDTGSSGLRILKGAIPDSSYTCSPAPTMPSYGYSGGLNLSGFPVYGYFAVTGVTLDQTPTELVTPEPIPIMYVNQIGCTADKPNCGIDKIPIENYGVLGTPYKAILGVGMRTGPNSVGNPFVQLPGAPAFVVQAPSYTATTGAVVIGPQSEQTETFKTAQLPILSNVAPLPNTIPAWDDRYGLPGCLDDQTSGVDYCATVELDTGDPSAYIRWTNATTTTTIPSGDSVQITIGPPTGPLGTYGFTVGATPKPGIDEVFVEPLAAGEQFMNLGTATFFQYDAIFDQADGLVGLASH